MEGRILHSFGMSETSKPPVLIKRGGLVLVSRSISGSGGLLVFEKNPKTLEKRRVGSEPREVEGRMLHSFGKAVALALGLVPNTCSDLLGI